MSPSEFEFLRAFLKKTSGLAIDEEKRYLVESRLGPVCRRFDIADLSQLVFVLKGIRHTNLRCQEVEQAVVEAMATNETLFFRDKLPFDQLKQIVLPRLRTSQAARKHLRIWCAAASSGQEPYSLAMMLDDEAAKFAGWRIEIVATDISEEVLDRAREGSYSQFEVQRGLPITALLKHFTKVGERWQISERMRAMVTFKPANLLRDLAHLGHFDLILCRNVLIYFDKADKEVALARIGRALAPGGCLLLGSAETVVGLASPFAPDPEHRGIYRVAPPGETARHLARIA